MKKQNLVCALIVIFTLCTTSLHAQFQWFANMIGPNPSSHCGSMSIRVGFSNNQNCALLLPTITLQYKAALTDPDWDPIATMTPSSPGATGDYYDFSPGATQSGYYRAIISTASGYTPCSGQTVASGTSNTVQHIVNPIPVADFNINGGTAGTVQTYQCASINLNYTGSGFATKYRYKIEECTSTGVVVVGGYSSNSGYAWVNGTLPASTDLNVGAVATRFDGFPGYYLVTLQVGTATCTATEKKVRIYVNASASTPTAAFKINNITPPATCTSPMELFGCPAYAITLSSQSANAALYMIDLQYCATSCGSYTPAYNSGYIPTFPTDLKNLPGLNGSIVQTQPGYYKVTLTTKNVCGAVSTTQRAYINVAGAPTGASASFTTTAKTPSGVSVTIGSCTMPATPSTTFKYDSIPLSEVSCGGPNGYKFKMEHSNPLTPNIVGRNFTVFDLSAVSGGTGSSSYSVLVSTDKYESGGWQNLNYLGQPENFTNAVNIPLTGLLWDNDANPYYGHFTTAPFLGIYRITITVSNECNTYTRTQVIKLVQNLVSKTIPDLDPKELLRTETGITIFPNPAADEVSFHVSAVAEDMVSISIYDIKGNRVLDVIKNAIGVDGENVYQASLRSLQAGMYFYKVKINDVIHNSKLIKQ